MQDIAERDGTAGTPRLGLALAVAGIVALVAAGALLWARQGSAVFSDYALSALAWCF